MKSKIIITTLAELYAFRLKNERILFRAKEEGRWEYLDHATREKIFIAADAKINRLKTVWRFCYSDLDLAILQILQNGNHNR